MSQPAGLLPYFLTFTSIMAFIHSAICYISPVTSLKPFSGPQHPPHTPLLAHIYAVMNILMGAIRAQAAYDISNKALYDLALGTYVAVIWLFVSEMVVWRTVGMRDIAVPFGMTVVGVGWMLAQRGRYVGGGGVEGLKAI